MNRQILVAVIIGHLGLLSVSYAFDGFTAEFFSLMLLEIADIFRIIVVAFWIGFFSTQ